MKVIDIFNFLNNLFPVSSACDFDNVGLLLGDGNQNVEKALVSLDCSLETVNYACENKCQLIITHHPVIFSPLKSVLKGSIAFELIRNNISVICMHTNLDIAKMGVSDTLAKIIGLEKIMPFEASDGFLIRQGVISPVSPKSFARAIKTNLKCNVKYFDGGNNINRVLVCSGSGGDYVLDAVENGFDALVTSEIKHHQFLQAKNHNISVFDCGHYETENIIIEPLRKLLCDNFKDLEIITHNVIKIEYL